MADDLVAKRAEAMDARGIKPEYGQVVLAKIAVMKTPEREVLNAALILYDHIAPTLRTVLSRAVEIESEPAEDEDFPPPSSLTEEEENQLFWGVHLMAAARDESVFPNMLRLLSLSDDMLAVYLAEAATISLPQLIAGTFNGDVASLLGYIQRDGDFDLLKMVALHTLAFLTFDNRVDQATTATFLRALYDEDVFMPGDPAWQGWADAIALLDPPGLADLAHAAFANGLIEQSLGTQKEWKALLAKTRKNPADPARFKDVGAGYIEDIYEELSWMVADEDGGQPGETWDDDDNRATTDFLSPCDNTKGRSSYLPPPKPVEQPLRNVGRNDPCPCGSGKKFKKCCLSK